MEEIHVLTEEAIKQFDYLGWNEVVRQELEGASDRAIVLICCSVLDAQLEKILNVYLLDGHEKRKKELFAPNGPLGTFSSKIEISFFCGLISEHERNTINTIRRIRNKFAHEIEIKDLEDESIRDLSKSLTIPDKMFVPEIIPYANDKILKFDTDPFKDGRGCKCYYVFDNSFSNFFPYKECLNFSSFDGSGIKNIDT